MARSSLFSHPFFSNKKDMKRLIRFTMIAAGLVAATVNGYSWGQKGHDITCSIAEQHLTKKARKQISEIFDGKSIVYWSSWMDNASHTPQYKHTSTWHYKNIDADETYETAQLNPDGDVVRAIEAQIEALKSGKLSKDESAVALRFLVHLVGDLHCPMHMGHKSDRGGNKWQVQFFGRGSNLHKIWDSEVIESARKWTYSEWTEQIDRCSKEQVSKIMEGDPNTWGKQTYQLSTKLYESTPQGAKLSYDYVNEWSEMLEQQLLNGGIRLAAVLNDIFR